MNLKRTCFFCGEEISGKKSMEHIIPDSLLGKMGIKEVSVSGNRKTQYSRIKVPAHSSCNSEFGSRFEDSVVDLFEDADVLYDLICKEEDSIPLDYRPSESVSSVLTTWLSKIYYGMFYDDYLKSDNTEWREMCGELISGPNFDLVRKSYKNGYGFQLPSSLYAFKTLNEEFDLNTIVHPSTILLKVGSITLILCICDGFLTKNYLNGNSLRNLRSWVSSEDRINRDFPSHKLALSEILALRHCIPKSPSFSFSDNQIVNMSLLTMVRNPGEVYKIDAGRLSEIRAQILREFGIQQ